MNLKKGIREVFRKARQAAPSVIFFDEIDSIAPPRGGSSSGDGSGPVSGSMERMVSQLLTEIDGMQEIYGVVVIAATNRIDMIDRALLRPGRFDKIIYIPNPDKSTRQKILEICTKNKPISRNTDLERISDLTEGFSGADVSSVVNTAISIVMHDYLARYPTPEEAAKHTSEAFVSTQHFEDAIKKIRAQREMKLVNAAMPQYG